MQTPPAVGGSGALADHPPVQDQPDEMDYPLVVQGVTQASHHLPLRDPVEAVVDVGPGHPAEAGVARLGEGRHRVLGAETASVGEAPRQQRRVDVRIEHCEQRTLDHPVGQRRHPELAHPARLLRDLHPVRRGRAPGPLGQRDRQVGHAAGSPVLECLDVRIEPPVRQRPVPYLLPRVEHRLLGESPRVENTHLGTRPFPLSGASHYLS